MDGTTFSNVHIEARMQLPQPGQGLWPAFWLFPTDLTYGKWAASGEIDIMESINHMETIAQGLHFGGPGERLAFGCSSPCLPSVGSWEEGLEWGGGRLEAEVRFARPAALGALPLQITTAASATLPRRAILAPHCLYRPAAATPPALLQTLRIRRT
jgi:hypothetical protein